MATDEALQQLLNLFDSYWFEHEILIAKHTSSPLPTTNPNLEEPNLKKVLNLDVGSLSEWCLSFEPISSPSAPSNMTITKFKPRTILSGKEIKDFLTKIQKQEDIEKPIWKRVNNNQKRGGRRRSRSLTELEFEEVKGFMDLGFVFSEEDKDSKLVSIIPGLQKWGRIEAAASEGVVKSVEVSRPYLSEAWSCLDERKVNNKPVLNCRVAALGNEIDIKDHLRLWAHTVASTVR